MMKLSPFTLVSPDFESPIPLPLGEVRLGRSRVNDVVVLSCQVTRAHATLTVARDGIELLDHGGTNGTYLNGVRVRDNYPLDRATVRVGDRISLGEVTFSVRLAE